MEENQDKHEKLYSFLKNWLVAGGAAAFARTAAAPIERVKVILQTQEMSPHFAKLGMEPCRNFMDCFRRIRKQHNMLAFWQGNMVNLLRYVPSVAFSFAFNDLLRSKVTAQEREEHMWSVLGRDLICGALAGVMTHTMLHPIGLSHTLITGDLSEPRKYRGAYHCLSATYKQRGIPGLYTGYVSAIIGVAIYRSTYFGMFETCKYKLDKNYGERLPFVLSWSLAQVVTCLAGFISYPFDTISRNQQMLGDSLGKGKVIGIAETVSKLSAKKGYSVLYKAAVINGLRSTYSAFIIVLYDEIQYRLFNDDDKNKSSFVTFRYHQFWRTRYPDANDK